MEKEDKKVIQRFVGHLRSAGLDLPPDSRFIWPDEGERNIAEIDAILGSLAIEHTTLDTFLNQRRHDTWFDESFSCLENEIGEDWPFRLDLSLPYSLMEELNRSKRSKAAAWLKMWLMQHATTLPNGWHYEYSIPEFNLPFSLCKREAMRRKCLHISRKLQGHEIPFIGFKVQVMKKAEKFFRYDRTMYSRILLLESHDADFLNYLILEEAYELEFGNACPVGVDSVWIAHDTIPSYFRRIAGAVSVVI